MEAVETKVVISLDTKIFEARLASLQQSVTKFEKLLTKAGDTKFGKELSKIIPGLKSNIDGLTQSIERNTVATNKASSAQDKLSKSTAQANFALINAGRVIQDIPFGMYAIANNIEPLITSFAYLSKSTAESGGAFKALLGSLTGTGGLILLASAASLAMTVFGDKVYNTGSKIDEGKKRIDDLTKSLKGVENIKLDASAESLGDITKVNALFEILNNTNKSYGERKKALDNLKTISKDYFGDLSIETASYEKLKKRVDEYTQSLVSQAVIKAYQDELTTLTKISQEKEKQNKLDKEILDKVKSEPITKGLPPDAALAQSTRRAALLLTAQAAFDKSTTELTTANSKVVDLQNKIKEEVKKFISIPTYGTDKTKAEKNVSDELYKIRLDSNERLKDLDVKFADDEIKRLNDLNDKKLLDNKRYYEERIKAVQSSEDWTEKEKQKLIKLYQFYQNAAEKKILLEADIEISEASFGKAAKKIEEQGTELAKRIKKGYQSGILSIGPLDLPEVPNMGKNPAGDPDIYEKYAKAEKKARSILEKANLSLSDIKGFNLFGDQKENAQAVDAFLENLKKIDTKVRETSNMVADYLTPVFTSFLDGLMEGSKKPFELMRDAIKGLIKQIAALIIKAAIAKAIMSVLFPSTIGAAAAMTPTGEGNFFMNLINGLTERNGIAGGFNGRGLQGSAIISNQSLVAEVRGNSLAFVLNRNTSSSSRLG